MIMRIRELREDAEMTQQQLANGMGVVRNAVSNWENEISLPRVRQLPAPGAPAPRPGGALWLPDRGSILPIPYHRGGALTMSCYDTNIYKIARLKAGKTQEGASEALGISVESLKAYESYSRLPPAGVVDRMCVVYDALYLAYQHNRIASGDVKVIPEIEVLDLPRASIRLINRVIQFAEKRRDRELLTIAEDGVISPEERPLYEEIVAELDGLIQAAMELKVAEARELQE